jgi:hypothetical protein
MPSSKVMRILSKLLKGRKGTRPARISTLLKGRKGGGMEALAKRLGRAAPKIKESAQGGQDLRLPVMGGTKFPTDDSKTGPASLLSKSQGKAEVGPAPSMKSLAPGPPTIPQVTGTTSSTMPKVGADMAIQNDPLMKYLKKQAEELKDNLEALPKSKPEKEMSTEDPTPAAMDEEHKGRVDTTGALGRLFDGKGAFRQKYTDKDRPVSSAQKIVDKVLNRG